MAEPIPFINLSASHHELEEETLLAVQKVLRHGHYILGNEVAQFEREWAHYCDTKYCISMATGLDALQAALLAMGLQAGDKVLMPANGFVATAFAIEAIGAKIVFCEVEPSTCNISVRILEEFSGKGIKAIIPVHLYGLLCPMDEILEWANRENVLVLEDAAQAHGANLNCRYAGGFGQAGAFSFYPTKNLGAAGDAGGLITNSEEIAKYCRKWRNYGMEQRFVHEINARNARMDTMQAAILSIRLKHLLKWTTQRQQIAAWYQEALSNCTDIILPPANQNGAHVYHLYVIQVQNRDGLKEHLSQAGIGTNIQYPTPIHLLPAMAHLGYKQGSFPVVESLSKKILSLPIWAGMNQEQVQFISKAIIDWNSK